MNTSKIKSDFHKLIDIIDDEILLQSFWGAMNYYVNEQSTVDIIDELSGRQKKRLQQSIEQKKAGKTLTSERMKQEIRQWLTK